MANTFKLKTKANVGLTTTNVYEVPTGTTSTVLGHYQYFFLNP